MGPRAIVAKRATMMKKTKHHCLWKRQRQRSHRRLISHIQQCPPLHIMGETSSFNISSICGHPKITYIQTQKQIIMCIRLIINSGLIIHLCHRHRRRDIIHIIIIIPTIITDLSRTHHHPRHLLQEQSFVHQPRVKRRHWQERSSWLQHLDQQRNQQ